MRFIKLERCRDTLVHDFISSKEVGFCDTGYDYEVEYTSTGTRETGRIDIAACTVPWTHQLYLSSSRIPISEEFEGGALLHVLKRRRNQLHHTGEFENSLCRNLTTQMASLEVRINNTNDPVEIYILRNLADTVEALLYEIDRPFPDKVEKIYESINGTLPGV